MHIYLFYFRATLDLFWNIACQYWGVCIKNGVLDLIIFLMITKMPKEYCMSILGNLY